MKRPSPLRAIEFLSEPDQDGRVIVKVDIRCANSIARLHARSSAASTSRLGQRVVKSRQTSHLRALQARDALFRYFGSRDSAGLALGIPGSTAEVIGRHGATRATTAQFISLTADLLGLDY